MKQPVSKVQIFTVYDSKAQIWRTPFFVKTKGDALRGFSQVCNDDKTDYGRYPEDFILFHLGEYDEFSGTFEIYKAPISLCVGIELKKVDTVSSIPNKDLVNFRPEVVS